MWSQGTPDALLCAGGAVEGPGTGDHPARCRDNLLATAQATWAGRGRKDRVSGPQPQGAGRRWRRVKTLLRQSIKSAV